DFQDLYDPTGHRLIAQSDSSAPSTHQGLADINELLCAGIYNLAVSGAGNLYFNPLIAGSGFPGQTGGYNLTLTATALPIQPGDGPSVLTTTPSPGAVLSSSPLAIRLDLSGPLDPSTIIPNPGTINPNPSTIIPNQNVELLYSPNGSFAQGGQTVSLWEVNFATAINELQLFPTKALMPGTYEVLLVGQSSGNGPPGLADPTGIPFGADSTHPDGQNFSYTFRVDGIEGNVGPTAAADDTPATAHNLGDITSQGLVQVTGAIGADPFYDLSSSNPAYNPGNDVNLYHFRINGPGRYAFATEVFAGRIGSPLDPGVSLYMLAPDGHSLEFIAGNNNTYDQTLATDGSTPLALDAALTAGLVAGDYYIAVSSGSNTPSPSENQPLNTPGLFNPTVSHSGSIGYSTGPYVLNLLVQPVLNPPWVIASSPSPGEVLYQSPTQITVQFSEPVNINQLAFTAFNQSSGSVPMQAVFIEDQNGVKYYPTLNSYDAATNTATFLMLDRLPSGSYALHLSGAEGLTDLAGNPLVGNSPDGDEVIPFQVDAPNLEMTLPTSSTGSYNLGVVFPDEWKAGVTLTENPPPGQQSTLSPSGDVFQFQVLQLGTYSFTLGGQNLPSGIQLSLTDAAGNVVPVSLIQNGQVLFATIAPGIYRLEVSGWNPALGSSVTYHLRLGLQSSLDNPPPLVSGPAPALVLHFGDTTTASPPSTPVPTSGGVAAGPLPLLPTGGSAPTYPGGTGNSQGGGLSATSAGGSLSMPPDELSEPNESHLSLVSLASGPLGGVGPGLRTETQATASQPVVSAPIVPGQSGLAVPSVIHTGINSLPSPADLNPGNEALDQHELNPSYIAEIEPGNTSLPNQAKPRTGEPLAPNARAENGRMIAVVIRNDGHTPAAQPDEAAVLAPRLDDATVRVGDLSEASAVPDWAAWVFAAGVLSLAFSRLSRWRRIRFRSRSALLSWQGDKETTRPWWKALAKPHFALCRPRRSDHQALHDPAACDAARA
ncbi:MAG: Ig-like domain-containing protein, partial [Isosphaeraceae bacterium]